eukprot:CAMPEP_0171184432 /NCGR_PEP_ID=MMETSP0790-20130122/15786_1 /TAXON_ID=2925 /ORGANISM="Alexandrium catenella, Strain OF101" /LENGTH=118 /DNA_ID=CAMNT_0011649429 /DNA_START=91 /DNA_END=447 /DNA_ORIENTATION=-
MSSNLDFLFDDAADEVAKAGGELSQFDRAGMKQPPAGWNASKSKADFQAGRVGTQGWKELPVGQAGPMGGGGSTGPALPFRIKETCYVPKAVGATPVYTLARPRAEDLQKADVISFVY